MAEFFKMPQASPTMEVGTVLAWRKQEGQELAPQDVLAEVETDKAAMEVEVFDRCFLLKILAQPGQEVPAGQPIAILGASASEDYTALLASLAPASAPAAQAPAAQAPAAQAPAVVDSAPGGWTPFQWRGRPVNPAVMEPGGSYTPPVRRLKVRASPLARRVAEDRGVDLSRVQGSGPHGRIVRADVEAAPGASAAGSGPPAGAAPHAGAVERRAAKALPNSKMRRIIAQRLKQSWLDAPVFYLTATLDCDRLVAFRAELNTQLERAGRGKVSFNDLTLAAVARALAEVPECNATWGEEAITRHGAVDLGVAVALDEGLITPVIRDADRKPLAALAAEVKDLVERARNRKLQPEEYSQATFSVSNLGMMGIEHFTAIINPPASGILAVGALQQEPVVREGQLAVGWRMRVTMTCDHRVIDGALGARLLQSVRKHIENPLLLVV